MSHPAPFLHLLPHEPVAPPDGWEARRRYPLVWVLLIAYPFVLLVLLLGFAAWQGWVGR